MRSNDKSIMVQDTNANPNKTEDYRDPVHIENEKLQPEDNNNQNIIAENFDSTKEIQDTSNQTNKNPENNKNHIMSPKKIMIFKNLHRKVQWNQTINLLLFKILSYAEDRPA